MKPLVNPRATSFGTVQGLSRPGHLLPQHHHLMGQHRNLHILRVGSRTQTCSIQQPAKHQ
jgi:hypothetical protein